MERKGSCAYISSALFLLLLFCW